MIHEKENNKDSQQHLEENIAKFNGDVKTVLQLLYSGLRLNANLVVTKYGLHDRRLRDAYAALPLIIKKEWKKDKSGKRLYVEYFIPASKLPTKKQAIEEGQRLLDKMNNTQVNSLFQ